MIGTVPAPKAAIVASPSGKVYYATTDAAFQQAIAQAKANG
jgi:hypothetical protein